MPHDELSDFEKLTNALSSLTGSISSFDDLMGAFGLAELPVAQRYGIFCGTVVFITTVFSVIMLLIFGGTFRRIAEQSETGDVTVTEPVQARKGRPLLLERLLEARERMMKESASGDKDVLVKRLSNIEYYTPAQGKTKSLFQKKLQTPEGYQEDYANAYRKCQDKPGGPILSGSPESRYEAYARAFAGCGLHMTSSYKWSYARMYEALACADHSSDDKYRKLFETRPQDVVGSKVRLEPLEAKRHADALHACTCGLAHLEHKSYDPSQVWTFLEYGPFENKEELAQSTIFQRQPNEAAFAIVDNVTDKLVGIIQLKNDDPKNLNVHMEPPILQPSSVGSAQQIEACFLLMDRLFALGYRRINMAMDSQDRETRKLPVRLGMTLEGTLPKHMIIKDSSRDSALYSMLNSDFDKGARAYLFKKLYGAAAQRSDEKNIAKESELEEQNRQLKLKAAEDKKKV